MNTTNMTLKELDKEFPEILKEIQVIMEEQRMEVKIEQNQEEQEILIFIRLDSGRVIGCKCVEYIHVPHAILWALGKDMAETYGGCKHNVATPQLH